MEPIPWLWFGVSAVLGVAFWAFLLWLAWVLVSSVKGIRDELVRIRVALESAARDGMKPDPGAVLAALLPALLVAGCGGDGGDEIPPEPVVAFDTARIRVVTDTDTLPLTVELAQTDAQRGYGLMERAELPADGGMLFTYEAPTDSTAGFWMYRTLIPLDIAFLDGDGGILDIRTMQPCESPNPRVCRLYGPGVPFIAALEMNAGWFAARGVAAGDRVERSGQ